MFHQNFYLFFFYFLKYFLLIMLLQFSQFFLPRSPLHPTSLTLQHSPPLVHVHGMYIYVLWVLCFLYHFLSLPVYFMPTNYVSSSLYLFPSIPPFPLPTEIPPCDVHFSDTVPVLVVCLVFVFIVCLFFYVHLLIVLSLLSFYCSYFWSSFS